MRLVLVTIGFLCGQQVLAEVPRVVTDIAPVQSIVARVMDGLGEPGVVVRPGASPHGYTMRQSEGAVLSDADLVVWMGTALTPWMEGPIDTLAEQARVIALMQVDGTKTLPFRHGVMFEGDGHDHGSTDPHAWLDPVNAQVWVRVIAEALAALDPENATTYLANASAAQAELTALISNVEMKVASVEDTTFLVFHDGYQYFEARFGVTAVGALTSGKAAPPGPKRLAALHKLVAAGGVSCVLSEPQFNPGLIDSVFGELGFSLGTVDPIGSDLPTGKDLYPGTLLNLADEIARCVGNSG